MHASITHQKKEVKLEASATNGVVDNSRPKLLLLSVLLSPRDAEKQS